jgi:hypothetical protein
MINAGPVSPELRHNLPFEILMYGMQGVHFIASATMLSPTMLLLPVRDIPQERPAASAGGRGSQAGVQQKVAGDTAPSQSSGNSKQVRAAPQVTCNSSCRHADMCRCKLGLRHTCLAVRA